MRSTQRPNFVEIETECHFMLTDDDSGNFYGRFYALHTNCSI